MIPLRSLTIGELEQRGEASLQTGPFGTQLKASEYTAEGTPVINVRNIGFGDLRKNDLEYLPEGKAAKLWQHHLKTGDIVFGRKGAVERHALIDADSNGWIQGSDCLRLRLKSKTVCEKYLSYYLRTVAHQDWMQALCSFGATMSSLNQDILRRLTFPAPPLATQRKIAAILSAYDDLIANNQRRITLLERMAKDIYREWFVRLRFPGHENVKIEKGVPQGWSVYRFRDVVQFYIGGGWGEEEQTATHSEPAYVIRGTDIPGLNNGDAQISSLRFHTPSNLKSRLMQKGDLVFEVSGGSKDQLLGRNLLVSERLLRAHDNKVICASFCKMLRFNTALVSPYVIKYFFKLYYETDLVGLYQVQSTGISNYQFEAFLNYQTVLLPPMDLQTKFDAMVEPILELKDDIALQTLVLRQTRDSLLPRLISGKLSVDALDIRFPPGMQTPESPV